MGIFNLQSNLNKGELDPLLLGRSDLESYYGGLKQAKKVLALPQGGVTRRHGTRYIKTLGGPARLESFKFSSDDQYLLAFEDNKMLVFKEGVLQTNISGSGNDYLTTTVPLSVLYTMDYTQSYDTIILTHKDMAPKVITRTSDTAWAIADITFTNQPQYNFDDGDSPTPTATVQDLTFANVNKGDRYRLSVDDFLTEDIVWSDTASENEIRIADALHALDNTGRSGITVSAASLVYTITFGGDSAGPYGLVTATPYFTQSVDFEGDSTITTTGISKDEDSWSSTRGWPVCSTFHGNRLWFGGSRDRPSTVWGSVIGDYYNFDKGKARDDELVELVIDSDELNAINHLVSNKKLQILTVGQHFFIPEDVITPNSSVISVNNEGCGIAAPVKLDTDILYSNRTGKRLNVFEIMNEYQPTTTRTISVLASHLINSPVSMAASRGTSSSDANYIYIVNFDGTMTVLNLLKNEGVEGFTDWVTAGSLSSVAIADDELYMVVLRDNSNYLLEKIDSAAFFDSTVFGTSTDTVDMAHLSGAVSGKGDGYSLGSKDGGGSVVFSRTYASLQAGYEFTPTIQTMPVNIVLGNGPQVSKKKRKRRAFIRVKDTAGLVVDGTAIPDRSLGAEPFAAITPATEQKTVKLRGWDRDATITITQSTPYPMTVLSINLEVAI